MNNHHFIFPFSDSEYIEIKMHSVEEALHCCTQIPMVYIMPTQEILMSTGSVKNTMYMFAKLLRKALANNLKLDASIHENIGYLYNKDLHEGRSDLKYERFGEIEFWVGESYKLCSYRSASWLYQDVKSDIILQITPLYFSENKQFDEKEYHVFMKNYAPISTRTLCKETAQIWLQKAEWILHEIEDYLVVHQGSDHC